MADKKIKPKKHGSLIVGALNRFTASIYSFFSNGRIGNMLSSDNTMCKKSYLAHALSKKNQSMGRSPLYYSEVIMERGIVSRAIVSFRGFMASLKLAVYGMFFTFFGLSSAVALMIPVITDGFSAVDKNALITAGIVTLCSLPMSFSAKSSRKLHGVPDRWSTLVFSLTIPDFFAARKTCSKCRFCRLSVT